MSTKLDNLRRLMQRDVKDHTALLDLYVTVGRDLEYLCLKFGIDPTDLINLLEGYGETIRVTSGCTKTCVAFGMELNCSGQGRLGWLPRILIEEYVERFYPGIASEKPENDWICLEAYLDRMHKGWRNMNVKG